MADYRSHDQAEIASRLNQGQGHFRGDTLSGLNLDHGYSREFTAAGCQWLDVSFSGRTNEKAQLINSHFHSCRLDHSGWPGLSLASGQWVQCNCREASFVQSRFRRWQASDTVFQNADFSGAHMTDSSFLNCEFFGALCRDAVFIRTIFHTTNYLGKNDIKRADLSRSLFVDVDLSCTDFSGSNLQDAIFIRSNLMNADFHAAHLNGALFLGCRK